VKSCSYNKTTVQMNCVSET